MHLVDIIGYVGCLCLTMLSLPQVYLSYTTKSTQGLSLLYLILGIITGCVYIVYGILTRSDPDDYIKHITDMFQPNAYIFKI